MDQYILNIIPRLIQNGKKLNQIESIVDKVWVKYGESNFETYRFKRNNVVLVSQGGFVEEKKWELLAPNGLYIGKDGRGYMFRQGIVFGGLLILQLESTQYSPILFYDEVKIPDGDIISYIQREIATLHSHQDQRNLHNPPPDKKYPEFIENEFGTDRGTLSIKRKFHNVSMIDNNAFLDGQPAPDGKYNTINEKTFKWFKVKKGIITDYEQH